MKYIKDLENLREKRVLLRLDLNVPLKNGIIKDHTRIDKILPIINFLLEKKSKILVISKHHSSLSPKKQQPALQQPRQRSRPSVQYLTLLWSFLLHCFL